MSYGELTLPPVWTGINKQNGRFLKGHVPANKGKKWSDYMGKRAMKRAAKGWKNLDKHYCPDCYEWDDEDHLVTKDGKKWDEAGYEITDEQTEDE